MKLGDFIKQNNIKVGGGRVKNETKCFTISAIGIKNVLVTSLNDKNFEWTIPLYLQKDWTIYTEPKPKKKYALYRFTTPSGDWTLSGLYYESDDEFLKAILPYPTKEFVRLTETEFTEE